MDSKITEAMRAIVGKPLRTSESYPVSVSDIRRWAIATYYPDRPPRQFWDEEYAAGTFHGGIVAPEEFNPFAWATRSPSLDEPAVAQTAFSETELGVEPPAFSAILLTRITERYGTVRIRPGDVIRSVVRISDYSEREGRMGHMLYTTLANEWHNQDGDWVRTTESVFVRY